MNLASQRQHYADVRARLHPAASSVVRREMIPVAPKPAPEPVPEEPKEFPLTLSGIVSAVAYHYGVAASEIRGPSRFNVVCRPRHVAFWLARQHSDFSLPVIGKSIGHRDHSTVLHGIRNIDKSLMTDMKLFNDLVEIRRSLGVWR